MNKMIISVLAKDRPGIIASMATDLCDLGCNLENVNQNDPAEPVCRLLCH